MIYFKLIVMIVCAGLNAWGGYSWHNARRFIMPVVIAVAVSVSIHPWWVGLTCPLAIAPLCLGYGDKSPLHHVFGDAWGRFIWMILVATALSMGLILTNHLTLWIGGVYVFTNGVLGITLRKYNQIMTDAVFGIGFASILFLIH